MVEVGEKYYYKTSVCKGRPFVGTVVRKTKKFVEFDHLGERVRVTENLVGRGYTFKAYVTKNSKTI